MTDNFDRRLTPRDPDPMKTPKEGDVFKTPNITDDGVVIGWYSNYIIIVVYDRDGKVFGVIPEGDPDTTYEIVWDTINFDEPCWVQDGAVD